MTGRPVIVDGEPQPPYRWRRDKDGKPIIEERDGKQHRVIENQDGTRYAGQ